MIKSIPKKIRNRIYKGALKSYLANPVNGICCHVFNFLINEGLELAKKNNIAPVVMYMQPESFPEMEEFYKSKKAGLRWFKSKSERVSALKKAIELTNPKKRK